MATGWLETPFSLTGKCVWVAGHNGMVGSAVLRRLEEESCKILTATRTELDLRNQSDVQDWVLSHKPDVIIICAAKVGGIGANAAYPADFFYDNIMISTNIIHSAYKAGCERLLCLGSSCIYPREGPRPIEEDALLSGKLEPTNEAYALAKIGALKMAQYYRTQYGCDFISAMPCNLYGPGDTYDIEKSHVIPALIMKAHQAKTEGCDRLEVWGSGKPLREFLYVDDLADALVFLLKNYNDPSHINVGSGQEITIKSLINIICETVEYKGEIAFDTSKPDGVPCKLMDNSRLSNAGWHPKISLKEGITKSYQNFINSQNI